MVAENEFAIDRIDLLGEFEREATMNDVYIVGKNELLEKYRAMSLEIKEMEAETVLKIARSPQDYNLAKATAVLVDATVATQPIIMDAKRELNKLKAQMDNQDRGLDGHKVKQGSMKHMVQLVLTDYYASKDPAAGVPTEIVEEAITLERGKK